MIQTTKTIFTGLASILILLVIVLNGCSSGPAHFRRMVSASETFERYNVLPGHQYYYFGRPHAPLAVVAIQEGYRLKAPKWTPVAMDEETLKDLVTKMLNQSS